MANNLFANVPAAVVAKQTISFVLAGITQANTRIIFRVGQPLKSFVPGRAINPISGFEAGQGYYIIPITDADLSEFLNPPLTIGGGECSLKSAPLRNFAGDVITSYPVGVFNVNGEYLGTAADAAAYATMWNADADNAPLGPIVQTQNPYVFLLPADSALTEVVGLRYYTWSAAGGASIFVGADDVVVYGSTIKKGSVDGVLTDTDTLREWNRALFGYPHKIQKDTVYVLACTGYVNASPLYVFHNENSKYVGVRHSSGMYAISGKLPKDTKAFYGIGQQSTNYNLVTNWSELKQLYSITINHAGGGVWKFLDPTFFPAANTRQITQVQMAEIFNLSIATSVNATNYPFLESFVLATNNDDLLTGGAGWFATMPPINKYFRYRTQAALTIAPEIADAIWNNVAARLAGVVPEGQKLIEIDTTGSVTAASQASRDALTAAGWTLAF